MTAPTLLTGCYRTGSHYLALLLHNVYRANGGGCGLHTTNWPREMHATVDDALEYAEKRWNMTPERRPTGASHPSGRWDQVMRALVGEPWCEKTQLNWRFIPTFLDWFPQGKAIIIVRDPRSVLASFREYTYTEPPAYLGAAFNCLDCMQWLWGNSSESIYGVRYEELASLPTDVVRVFSRRLGLDYPGDAVALDTSDWPDVPGSRWQDRSSFGRADELDVDKAIHRWKDHLSERELRFVETICATHMERFGYEIASEHPMNHDELREMVSGSAQLEGWLEHWIETGEGSVGFPLPADDPSTWAENAEVA